MKTTIHTYRFNIDNSKEHKTYDKLCAKLKKMGLHVFAGISLEQSDHHKKLIQPLNGQKITLETKYLFENQWNTAPTSTSENGLRVFDWHENIYPNRLIKEGQWLEQTKAMTEIRQNTFACGYCGKQVYKPKKDHIFCTRCRDSEYLEVDNLKLLRLYPVAQRDKKYPQPTGKQWIELVNSYRYNQLEGHGKRAKARLARDKKYLEKKYAQDTKEYEGKLWLLDNSVMTDVIYYSYRDIFTFGWQKPVKGLELDVLLDKITEFPFEYEIKGYEEYRDNLNKDL